MNASQDNPLALEAELAEAIDHFFETARAHDFEGSKMVTHLGTSRANGRTMFGTRRVREREGLVHSRSYLLWEADWSRALEGMYLAVEGVFIEVPYGYHEWPRAIERPRATRELIDKINIVIWRIEA
jgi:hypothetical protein